MHSDIYRYTYVHTCTQLCTRACNCQHAIKIFTHVCKSTCEQPHAHRHACLHGYIYAHMHMHALLASPICMLTLVMSHLSICLQVTINPFPPTIGPHRNQANNLPQQNAQKNSCRRLICSVKSQIIGLQIE